MNTNHFWTNILIIASEKTTSCVVLSVLVQSTNVNRYVDGILYAVGRILQNEIMKIPYVGRLAVKTTNVGGGCAFQTK